MAFGHLLLWSCIAAAQSGGAAPAPEPAKPAAPSPTATAETPRTKAPSAVRVEEARPSVYYLPDKQGVLQPVLDFKYQDFVELYRLKNQLGRRDEPPRYTIQRMTASGTAGETNIELNVQIQILVRDDAWVRIPLRFDQGLLRGDVKFKGPGEQFVNYEADGDGYVCWIRGKSDTQHEITLVMLVPLTAVGDETRLKLYTPRATASELKLTTPMAGANGTVSEGATLLPSAAADSGATVFSVVGLGGDFQLAWRKGNPYAAEKPLVLEATGSVLSRLDGRSITAEAALSVRSYGGAFDRLTVRLPPEMELSPGNESGYTVTALDAASKEKDGGRPRLVEVRLNKKTAGPFDIRLACRREYDPLKSQAWCDLAGFEIVGAARQSGVAAVAAGNDWQVLWGPSSDVRQTDQLPEALRKDDVAAGFEYSNQPYALSARLTPRKTRVNIEPKYVVLVDRDAVRLDGKLTCTIRSAKITSLDVAMPGWELDEAGPEGIVAVDGVTLSAGKLTIPLLQPSSGTVEVQLRAHRVLKTGAKSLAIPLPQPLSGASGPASVAVVPADNVEITPDNQHIEGLTRQRTAPPSFNLPERQQDPLYYRGTGNTAVFAADFQVHSQRITVDVAGQVTFVQREVEVEQRFSYFVAYEPVDRFNIVVPRALTPAKRIQILYDGKPLPIAATDDRSGVNPAAPVSLRVTLPGPRIGACELTVRYSFPIAEPTPQQSALLSLPLPMPENGQLAANTLVVKETRNMRVSPRKGSAWSVVDSEASASDRDELRLSASKSIDRADLELRWKTDDTAGSTVIDRAWIQTWLTSSARQDRAVYQLTTNNKELEVIFPEGASIGKSVVLVDGKRVESRPVGEDRLLVPLVGSRDSRRFVVELRYHFPDECPPRGALSLAFPRIGSGAWMRRMYWQLVLPANEHLLVNPDGFTNEFHWGWQGYFWGRQPLLDQSQLESWIGAAPRDPLSERANLYLFSTLGNVDGAEIRTAARTWIVFWASGAALVAGLLLIYVPAGRHPVTLLTVGMTLLAAGLVAPEPTLLLAQAASLGLALSLLAGFLDRGASRRRPRTSARKESSSSSRVEVGSTHSPYRMPIGNSQPPTETLPAVPPQSTGNPSP